MLFKSGTDHSLDIEPFAKCPSCRQLIKLKVLYDTVLMNVETCPFCHTPIEKSQISDSYETYLRTIKAIKSAAHLSTFKWALIIIFGQVLFQMTVLYGTGVASTLFAHAAFLLSIFFLVSGYFSVQKWLDEFAYLEIDDKDFIAARKEMRRTRLFWVAAIIVNLFLWFFYLNFSK